MFIDIKTSSILKKVYKVSAINFSYSEKSNIIAMLSFKIPRTSHRIPCLQISKYA